MRGRASHGGGGGALHAANRAIDKTDEARKAVKSIHVHAKMIADVLRPDLDIANILRECDPDGAEGFLQDCHDKLKAIGEGNAKRMYEIDNFAEAMKEVATEVEQNQNAAADENNDAPDYERSINEAVERVRQRKENDPDRVPPVDHQLSTEIREALGEKIKKRARASRGGDDDEDDLEIVQGQKDDVHTLKCPLTGMLYEDPLRNKVCGHVYDRAGLQQMIHARKTTCPVPGCANKSVTMSQVEPDEEMKLKVKRHKTREEAEKKKRELEEEVADGDDEEAGGYTVLE